MGVFSKTKKTGARTESNILFWDSFSPRTSLFISENCFLNLLYN